MYNVPINKGILVNTEFAIDNLIKFVLTSPTFEKVTNKNKNNVHKNDIKLLIAAFCIE